MQGLPCLGCSPSPGLSTHPTAGPPPSPSLAFKAFSAQDLISFSLLINNCALAAVS